jgi:hypothetical protein
MVATVARVILVVIAPLTGTAGVVSSPLVHSCGGVDVTDMQEPGVEEPSGGGGALHGVALFLMRPHQIKQRIEAKIALLSGSAFLPLTCFTASCLCLLLQ